MLAKKDRIKNSDTISLLLKEGKFLRLRHFTIRYLSSGQSGQRLFTVVIPKKNYSTLVERNKYRRRGMALLAKTQAGLKKKMNVILILAPSFLKANLADMQAEIANCFKQMNNE
jgi:ribonuclease P protein component